MRVIPRSEWVVVKLDGEPAIRVTCPYCQTTAFLDHQIDPDGTVSPSLRCCVDGCDFHEAVRLEGFGVNETAKADDV